MLHLAWLLLAVVIDAQFNTTFEFVLDPLSPAISLNWMQWAYDDETGYLQNVRTRRSSGGFVSYFVAQRGRMYGEVADRPEVPVTGSRATLGWATGTGGLTNELKEDSDGLLGEVQAAGAATMWLRASHLVHGLVTLHNITLDVPARTQA